MSATTVTLQGAGSANIQALVSQVAERVVTQAANAQAATPIVTSITVRG